MKKLLVLLLCFVMVFSMAACGGDGGETGGNEAQTYELTVSIQGSEDIRQVVVWKAWADEVTKRTDGRVTFKFFYNSTLLEASSGYSQLVSGLADIGDVHLFASDGFPMFEKWKGFTLGTPIPGQVAMAKQLYEEFDQLQKECQDVYPIGFAFDGGSYQILTVEKEVHTVDDLKGMTIWCEAGFNDFFKACGATPVNTPWAEVYSSLQKNMYDGLFIAAETLKLVNFAEVCDHATMVGLNYLAGPGLMMNKDTYESLPDDIKAVFDDPEVRAVCEGMMETSCHESDAECVQWSIDTHGTNVIYPTDEAKQEFVDVLNESKKSIAAEFDEQGLPGTEMLERIIELSGEYAE